MRHLTIAATLMLAACGQAGSDNHADMIDAPGNEVVANVVPAVPQTPLTAWRGKYPSDKINGTGFFELPRVLDAVDTAIGAGQPVTGAQLLAMEGPETPIATDGDMLVAWRCEAHNCGPHNWALRISTEGQRAEVCYHDDDAKPATLWFADGKRLDRTEDCQREG